jgi:hypothetical protein
MTEVHEISVYPVSILGRSLTTVVSSLVVILQIRSCWEVCPEVFRKQYFQSTNQNWNSVSWRRSPSRCKLGSVQAHTVPKGNVTAILGLGDIGTSIDTIVIKGTVVRSRLYLLRLGRRIACLLVEKNCRRWII